VTTPVTAATPPRSPVRCAELLRSMVAAEPCAELIAQLDPRFARLVLCALRDLVREDHVAPVEARDHDEALRLLLQLRIGIFDWAIITSTGGQVRFAVVPEVQGAVDRVVMARLEEMAAASSH
jgi:hypothetical protein